MLKKLAVAAVVVGLAPAAAWAAPDTSLDLGTAAQDSSTSAPAALDRLFAQADDQTTTGSDNGVPPEHYTESGGTATSTEEEHPWGPDAGDMEFTLNGTGSNDSNFGVGSWGVGGSFGYYLTRNFELSLRETAAFANGPNGGSNWAGSTLGAIDFNLPLDRFVPFVGINGGVEYAQGLDPVALFGGEGGLKFYVYPKTFVFGSVAYEWPTNFSFLHRGYFVWNLGIGFNF